MSDAFDRPIVLGAVFSVLTVAAGVDASHAQPVDMLANPTSVTVPQPGAVDFEVGQVEYAGAVELLVAPRNSNKTWYLYVRTDDANLGGYGKAIDDLLYRVEGTGTWTSIDSGERLVATGVGDDSVLLEVAIALDWAVDEPGTYAGDFLFRVAHAP